MSYQALYRVWRPQRFSDLVGQQIVSTTLKNAIITKKLVTPTSLPVHGERGRHRRRKFLPRR